MRKSIIVFIVLISAGFYSAENYAQCSDAGVCSIGGHSMEQERRSLFNVSASYKYGSSGIEDDVKYNSVQVGAFYSVLQNTSFQLLIPYNMQSGPLGNVSGIGDLMVSATQNIYSDENSGFNVSFGFKLATGDDNKDKLPMAYQSGLGSNDVIIALNYTYDKLSVGTGYQFAGKRNNNFLKLKRGDDLLIRAGYNFQFDKLIINPQVLFIKRLDQSNIYNPNYITQQFFDIENSDQTQLNLLVLANYKLNNNFTLFTDLAVPFIKREVNVDGLTRAFSASVGVKFSIN